MGSRFHRLVKKVEWYLFNIRKSDWDMGIDKERYSRVELYFKVKFCLDYS